MAEQSDFEAFKALFADVQTADFTGDPSLDLLLRAVPPPVAEALEKLAVPHWFDAEMVAAIGNGHGDELFEELTHLSLVRGHPYGYAYHDLARELLRNYFLRTKPAEAHATNHVLADLFARRGEEGAAEEVRAERIYFKLGYDEQEALPLYAAMFAEARRARRFSIRDTLVSMGEEQRPLLSPNGVARIDVSRGVLLFDLRRWDEAQAILDAIPFSVLEPDVEATVHLFRGRVREAKGLWQAAERVYLSDLMPLALGSGNASLIGRLHQRLATTYLYLGDLHRAEEHARKSLNVNRESGDQRGQAANFRTLGATFTRLRRLDLAEDAYNQALGFLEQTGNVFESALVYMSLGDLFVSFGRWPEGERAYVRAQQIRIEAADNHGLAYVYANLGALYLKSGDATTSLRYSRSSLELFDQFHDRVSAAKVSRNIALAFERAGDLPSALAAMEDALLRLPTDHSGHKEYARECRDLARRARRQSARSSIKNAVTKLLKRLHLARAATNEPLPGGDDR